MAVVVEEYRFKRPAGRRSYCNDSWFNGQIWLLQESDFGGILVEFGSKNHIANIKGVARKKGLRAQVELDAESYDEPVIMLKAFNADGSEIELVEGEDDGQPAEEQPAARRGRSKATTKKTGRKKR
jgi:hypothetical protein